MPSPYDLPTTRGERAALNSLSSKRAVSYLLLIVLLGAVLRFYDIRKAEPVIWDEGVYFLEAKFLSTVCSALWQSGRLFIKEKITKQDLWKKEDQLSRIRENIRGLAPRYGRMTHDSFSALGFLLFGEHPYIGNLVNALLGTLTIFWVFLLGRLMYTVQVGLGAALIFSVMGYHIHYSRSGLAEADFLFFLVPAFYYYYKSRFRYPELSQKDLGLSGLLLGIAFTLHNQAAVMFGIIFFLEILLFWRPGKIPGRVKKNRLLIFFFLFLIPSLFWEGIYYVALIIHKELNIIMTCPTYVQQILKAFCHSLLWGYISKNFRPAGFLSFPYLYQYMNGIVALILLAIGLFVAIKRRLHQDKLLCIWFLFPFILYSLTSAGLTRFFALILPPAAILSAAAFLPAMDSRVRFWGTQDTTSRILRSAILAVLVITGIYCAWTRVLPSESGYGVAMDFLKERGTTHQVATGVPQCQVYVGVDEVERPPESMEELERLYQKGVRYYTIDYNRIIYTYYQMNRVEVMDQVAHTLSPTFSVSNNFVKKPQIVFEGNLYFWDTLEGMKKIEEEKMNLIRIYDLSDYFEPSSKAFRN